MPPPPAALSQDDIDQVRAHLVGTPAEALFDTLLKRQPTIEQEYFLFTIELMRIQRLGDEAQEEALTDRMDALWWSLPADRIEALNETHDMLVQQFHEIWVASQAHQEDQAHKKVDEDASIPEAC
jgi:hypothetical protein